MRVVINQSTLFKLLQETEAGTRCDHITLNFERQDGYRKRF